ncbi:hypothetical protein HPB50_019299 [Hyalomma asiaticum]|uniref:Uncharacterized protein n=1 Tax=Hyalomma asiaticum TaxID=266040 RepID=A0ACB7RT09_HYAAI|nr:hypothetical protein HPB50_019299 [Hyalomma asiaticum]
MDETTTGMPAIGAQGVATVQIHLPSFWPQSPAAWFTHVEVIFTLRRITSQQAKFHRAVFALSTEVVAELYDVTLTASVSQSNKRRPKRKEKGHTKPAWKPMPLQKFHPDDFVVVLKPRTTRALRAIFQAACLGEELAVDLSFVLSCEQNLIVESTKNAYMADRLLGDFVINSSKGDVPSTAISRNLARRSAMFGTSNKARLTFAGKVKPRTVHHNSEIITVWRYFRAIPPCGVCGTVGHRADTCPNPSQDRCGLCGQQAPFVEGMRTPHECNVKCGICGAGHATNSKDCVAKYRKDTKMTAQIHAEDNPAMKPATRQPTHVTGGDAPPSGLTEKRGAAAPPPPHGGQGNQSRSQQQQPKVQGASDARASTITNDKKVSGTSGVASSSPSSPSSPSCSTGDAELHNVLTSLQVQNELLVAKIEALEKLSTRPPQPAPHAKSLRARRRHRQL